MVGQARQKGSAVRLRRVESPSGGSVRISGMFMTLLTNVLWMFFLLLVCVLFYADTASYRQELESIDIPEAE